MSRTVIGGQGQVVKISVRLVTPGDRKAEKKEAIELQQDAVPKDFAAFAKKLITFVKQEAGVKEETAL